MKKKIIFIFLELIIFLVSAKLSSAVECGSVPTNFCGVTQNTEFNQGTYNFPDGIAIGDGVNKY